MLVRQRFFTGLVLGAGLWLALSSNVTWAQKEKDQKPPALTVAALPRTAYSDVRRDNLLNGFQVITLERANEPLIKCDVIVRTGAMFDLSDKTGLAQLTQATLLAVNPRVKEEFESLGAKLDWGVTHDLTWFRIESPVSGFDTAMEIFARLLVTDTIHSEPFTTAQQNLIAQRKAAQLTAAQRADEALDKAIYGFHPYGHNVTGDEKSLMALKQGDVYDFMRRFYVANNAFAVVVGSVKHERIMRTFKPFFGGWTKSALVPPTFRAPQPVTQLKVIKVESDAPMLELRGGVLGLRIGDSDYLASELLVQLAQARLRAAGLKDVSVQHAPRRLAAVLQLSASVAPAQAQTVSRQMTETIATLATQEVKPNELIVAKSALITAAAARPVEQFLRDIEAYELPKDYPLKLNERIDKLTAADVQRVAKRLLDANAFTIIALGRVSELNSQL